MAGGMFEVKVTDKKLRELTRTFKDSPRDIPRVLVVATNRAAKEGRTIIVRKLHGHTKMKQKYIRKAITVDRATFSYMTATIQVANRRIPLIAMGARKVSSGVSVIDMESGGKREVIKHAFIQTMPKSGHKGVFLREDKYGEVTSRLPIREQFAAGAGKIFAGAVQLANEVMRDIGAVHVKHIDSQVARLLARKRAAA